MRAAQQATDELRGRLSVPLLCQGEDSTAQLVKKFAEDQFFKFVAGQYYRVKLAVGTPWSESTMLIRVTAWTPWLNSDGPGGVGDFELLANFVKAGQACPHPLDIQCQTTSGVDWKAAGQVYTCDVNKGGVCIWSPQNQCFDYRVRFRC